MKESTVAEVVSQVGISVALQGNVTEDVKSGSRVVGGLIGLSGNAQLSIDEVTADEVTADEDRQVTADDLTAHKLLGSIGSRFDPVTTSLLQRLDVTQTSTDDAVWVLTENFANQIITGLYQTGKLSELIPPSLEVGPLLGANVGARESVPLIDDIVAPTIKYSDELRINFDMQSLPHVEFVEVDGQPFIEMHLTGLVVKADIYKSDISDNDYTHSCDKFCSGTGSAISVSDANGLRVPDALDATFDVVARIEFSPNSETHLPEVSIDTESMSVNVVSFSTFIDRIYSRSDLGCTGDKTFQGGFVCSELEPFLYTKVMFMADIPSMLGDNVGASVQTLLESNVGGLTAAAFDDEKQLKFVMTSFGVNAEQKYMTLGVDVCDNGVNTPVDTVGGDCAANYGAKAKGIYELTICDKFSEWNKTDLMCELKP